MDNPASTADLVKRGYALPAGSEAPQTRLDEAWRALQREPSLPDLVARMQSDPDLVQSAVDVVAAAALRVLRNPEGVESETGAIDDYRESWKHADPTQDLYFTTAELRRLMPVNISVPTAGSFKYA